jgi:hypothetical protein
MNMENYLEQKNKVLEDLAGAYKNLRFECLVVDFKIEISTFFVIGSSEIFEINDTWQRISEEIALKYQSRINSIANKWNIYIIYMAKDSVRKELKNKIEADKFSSRKIVEDCFEGEFSETIAYELIVKHITNTDLDELVENELDKKKHNIDPVDYIPSNKTVWDSIPIEDLKRDTKSQNSILLEIAKRLTNEN